MIPIIPTTPTEAQSTIGWNQLLRVWWTTHWVHWGKRYLLSSSPCYGKHVSRRGKTETTPFTVKTVLKALGRNNYTLMYNLWAQESLSTTERRVLEKPITKTLKFHINILKHWIERTVILVKIGLQQSHLRIKRESHYYAIIPDETTSTHNINKLTELYPELFNI
jgi:hypothetical protein